MSHKYANDFHIDNGVVRWNSNNHVPFNDMLLDFIAEGLITQEQFINSKKQREIDVEENTKRYRLAMANHVPDEEELFEMRSAFGEGATVVNVLTGKKIKL